MADRVVQTVKFRVEDDAGKQGTLTLMVPTDTGTDPITDFSSFYALFNAVSDGVIVGQVGGTVNADPTGTAASAAFDSRDKLIVECINSQGGLFKIAIPDPDPAAFMSDTDLIDPSYSHWGPLKTAIAANIIDKTGGAVSVVRGYRQRSRRLKSSERFA